jgi:hypothetical protein
LVHPAKAILCERDHADGGSRDLLKARLGLPVPPNPYRVSAVRRGESLRAEAPNPGGFGVLMMAFRARGGTEGTNAVIAT